MTIGEMIKMAGKVGSAFVKKIINSDAVEVFKIGTTIGTAILTVVKGLSMFRKRKGARDGSTDDTMTSFNRRAAEDYMRNPVDKVIARVRSITKTEDERIGDDYFDEFDGGYESYKVSKKKDKKHKKHGKKRRMTRAEKEAEKEFEREFAQGRAEFMGEYPFNKDKERDDEPTVEETVVNMGKKIDINDGPVWLSYIDTKNPEYYVKGFARAM